MLARRLCAVLGWAAVALAAVWVTRPASGAAADADAFDFAEGLFVHQDYTSAAEEFGGFLAKYPDSAKAPAAAFRLGECWLRLEDYGKAATALEQALARHATAPQAPLGTYNLARARLRLAQTEPALEAFLGAAKAGQGAVREESLVGAAECCITLERLAQAVEHYQALLAEFPKTGRRAEALFSLGWTLARLQRHEEAAKVLTDLLAEFPEASVAGKARLALSDAWAALGQHDRAAQALRQVPETGVAAEDVLLRQAWSQFRGGDRKGAAESFEQFVTRFPTHALAGAALFNAGVSRLELKEYEAALGLFQRVEEGHAQAKEAPEARLWAGVCLFQLGRFAEAADRLAPLAADPARLPEARREPLLGTYAQALGKAGRQEEAVTALRAFLRDFPASAQAPVVTYSLARALGETGHGEDAVALLDPLVPTLTDADLQANARFALAEYLYRLHQPAKARPHLEALVTAGRADDKTLYRLGWACFDTEDWAAGLKAFAEVSGRESTFTAEALFMAGRAAEKLSRNDEAIGFYERLLARTAVDEFVGKGHYQLAFLLRGEAAERNLSRYRERFPTAPLAPEMTLALAESRFAAGDMAGAEKAYTELAEAPAAPAKVRTAATYGLGWCLLRQERLADADARFAAVAAPAPEAGEALVRDAVRQRGEIAYRQERFPEAEALFARLRDDPGHGERALYMLGWCARKRQAEDEAAAAFRLVLERYPKGEFAADSGLRLGEALNDKGLSAEARTVLAAARDRDPPPALAEPILLELGEAEVALEDWPAVRATAERFAERFPQSARAYLAPFRLGLACQGLGLLDEAEKHFRDTIAATETIEAARAQFNLGAIQFSRQQYLEAAKAFLRVEMLYDYEDLAPRSLYHAALSFQRAGDSKRAELYRARLLEKHPDSEWARKPLGEEGK